MRRARCERETWGSEEDDGGLKRRDSGSLFARRLLHALPRVRVVYESFNSRVDITTHNPSSLDNQ
jgi:hypothetical protein